MEDKWLNDYDKLKRLSDEINAEINERNRAVGDTSKYTTSIRRKLNQLASELGSLSDELGKIENTSRTKMTDREYTRRKDLLNNLIARKDQLNMLAKSSTNSVSSAERDDLIGGKGRTFAARETEQTKGNDNQNLLNMQDQVIKSQDVALDSLNESVLRTMKIAKTINQEADIHNEILDDLNTKTDKTTNLVKRETERVSRFTEKQKTGCLWVIICLLVIVLIVLIATDGGCKVAVIFSNVTCSY